MPCKFTPLEKAADFNPVRKRGSLTGPIRKFFSNGAGLAALLISSLLLIPSTACFSADNTGIEVFFSPGDECGREILDKIGSSKKSIEVAMYLITSGPLSRALAAAAKRGVTVRIFLDGENAKEHYSKANFLKRNGVAVKLETGEGLMHNKFCIIDDKMVITGSYNWTVSADLKNDENVIFVNSKKTARLFRMQFEKYWQGSYTDKAYYRNKNFLKKLSLPGQK
ncbi:MAG: phospholipase D family protein [Candidatus Omnitrophota bacterium]|nr:phospholipase D family protein [Candidatus Omnitrophota bacterium]